jgi:hypothetical protein
MGGAFFVRRRGKHMRKRLAALGVSGALLMGGTTVGAVATAGSAGAAPAGATSVAQTCRRHHGTVIRVDRLVIVCLLPGGRTIRL